MMTEVEFKQGPYNVCIWCHKERNIRAVARADGFAALGRSEDLDWLRSLIENRMEVKFKERLSREREGSRECQFDRGRNRARG